MAPADIEQKLKATISDQLGVAQAEIQPGSALVEDLGADSLDVVELVMAIEEEFSVEIPDDEVPKLKTVQDAVDYITARAA